MIEVITRGNLKEAVKESVQEIIKDDKLQAQNLNNQTISSFFDVLVWCSFGAGVLITIYGVAITINGGTFKGWEKFEKVSNISACFCTFFGAIFMIIYFLHSKQWWHPITLILMALVAISILGMVLPKVFPHKLEQWKSKSSDEENKQVVQFSKEDIQESKKHIIDLEEEINDIEESLKILKEVAGVKEKKEWYVSAYIFAGLTIVSFAVTLL
ncbi:hypothetical protein ACFVRR_17720 [Gottfriedia sp. NPDC057948]|uniref:hypothetical protein n=1 Tax=Gottfriedia sp. NPDC057948 TaxID=3346287 RepID=UPI0036DAA209